MQPTFDLHALAPEIALSITVLVVLVVDAFLPRPQRWMALPLGVLGLLVTLATVFTLLGESRDAVTGASAAGGGYVVDDFALLFKGFFLIVGVATLLLSGRFTASGTAYPGEYTFLLLSSILGCLVVPSVRDLLTLFIAIELVSAPAFLLAAFRKRDLRSNEAGLKFFLFGVVASAVMLYGMSLLYGLTGTVSFGPMATALAGPIGTEPVAVAAVLFVLGGLMFKISAVPFHFWAPDTYEGAPTPVAAFLSVASKAAGFVGLALLCFLAFPAVWEYWTPILAIVSMLTMTLGNLVALQQRQMVRLLSYSSIAQAGYMLLPLALVGTAPAADALSAVVIYILIYAAMNLGAFAVVIGMSKDAPEQRITDYTGLLRRAPLAGIAMSAFLVSLAGIPPTAGFWAKFFIFRVAIEAGGMGPWLAGFMVVNSVVALFYYLSVVRTMLRTEGVEDAAPLSIPRAVQVVIGVSLVLIVVWFVLPDLVVNLTRFAG